MKEKTVNSPGKLKGDERELSELLGKRKTKKEGNSFKKRKTKKELRKFIQKRKSK